MAEITVPLNKLHVADANVRIIEAHDDDNEQLKMSIANHGLLQNLIVHEEPDNPGTYAVDGGRRRLNALKSLAEDGTIDQDHPIPCLDLEDAALATEASLAENFMRVDMHPADQVEAFAKLVDEGLNRGDIAMRFGMTEAAVAQRLRLGNVSPIIMQAYRDGDIGLNEVKAFGLTDDQTLQETLWNDLIENNGYIQDYHIRGMLLDEKEHANSKIGKFVGIEAYEAAGGTITQDLFARDTLDGAYMNDSKLLYQLATDKLNSLTEEIEGDWKWVANAMQWGYEERSKYSQLRAIKGKLTKEEVEESNRLTEQINTYDPYPRWGTPEHKEVRELEDKRQKINYQKVVRSQFTEEQRSVSGCVVSIDYNGRVEYDEGLVRKEDLKEASVLFGNENNQTGRDTREKVKRATTGYSTKLFDSLREDRNQIVQQHLAKDFDTAFDLFLYDMIQNTLSDGYHNGALDIAFYPRRNANTGMEALDASTLSMGWFGTPSRDDQFKTMSELPFEAKKKLFAMFISGTLNPQLTNDDHPVPEIETVIERLEIDFAVEFRPTVDNFWNRLTKPSIIELVQKVFTKKWATEHSKLKKADLAAACEKAFAIQDEKPTGVTPAGFKRMLAWTPIGFTNDKKKNT